MLLVGLNCNFEFDWFVEPSDNKLSDNNLASELVGNRSFFKPIVISNSNWTEWSTIQGVIGRVMSKLIVTITKFEKNMTVV